MNNFADLFEKHLSDFSMHEGQVIKATVVAIDNKFVAVDAGLKSESLIATQEFKDDNNRLEVQVGDVVDVIVETMEDGHGETRLSREKAKRAVAWSELKYALENQSHLSGVVYGRVKGGLGVLYKNVKLFLPGSLIDVLPVRDCSSFEGKTIEFCVIKIDERRNNIVVSRKATLVAQSSDEDIENFFKEVTPGRVMRGTVKNITDYGAFVDLSNPQDPNSVHVDGLVYITDIAWRRINHPSDLLAPGQELDVVVLKCVDHKISLGIKQLLSNPWNTAVNDYPVGSRVEGIVSNITPYGAFVELQTGIEGLIHVSEMDWTNKNVNPNKLFTVGDRVTVEVLSTTVNNESRKISLGYKQCFPNPWVEFANNHKKDDKISGIIHSITDFGLFVGLPGDIDGLVHISDISWNQSENALSKYKKNQRVEAIITSIANGRVALSIKHLDALATFIQKCDKGSMINATIVEVHPQHLVISIDQRLNAELEASEIFMNQVHDLSDSFKVGEKIKVSVVELDKKAKTFKLSALERKSDNKASSTTSLGSILQDRLNEIAE